MELSEIEEAVEKGKGLVSTLQVRSAGDNCTASDARVLLEMIKQISNPAFLRKLDKLHRRVLKLDPETNKPTFKASFIEAVENVVVAREKLYDDATALFEEIKHLDEEARMEEQKHRERQLQLDKERKEKQEAFELAEKKAKEEKERLETERKKMEAKKEFEQAADKVQEFKDATDKLFDAEKARAESCTIGIQGVAKALETIPESKRIESLSLLADTFLRNIVHNPEKKEFFRINAENPKFQSQVLEVPGCTEVLISIGFKITLEVEEKKGKSAAVKRLVYILQEPLIDPGEIDLDKLDAWEDWYNQIKLYFAILERGMVLSQTGFLTLTETLKAISEDKIKQLLKLSKEDLEDAVDRMAR